ncbi:MAG: MFS transporter [Collinsella sp.]
MQKELGVGLDRIQLVSSVYLLATCVAMLPFGRLGDVRGKVNVFQLGVIVFTGGSLLCGLSGSLEVLILARFVQGIGCAAAMANNMGIITESFPARERGRAMGILATFVALGMMCGPVLGGVLVASFPWESIFLINLPIGVISFIVGLYTLPHVKPEADERPMPLTEAARRCFASSAFTINLACMLIVFVGIGASEFVLPFYFQDAHGFSSDISGLLFLAMPVVNAFVGPLSGSVSDRVGCEAPTAVGLGVYVCGLFAVSTLDEHSSILMIVCCVAFMSCGTSIFQSPNNSLYGFGPREALGFAGSLTLARYAGIALGITAASRILYGQTSAAMGKTVTSYVAGRPDVFLFGFRLVFYVLMAVATVGFALTLVRLVRTRARH